MNGDGTIGLPPLPATVIEALGSTSLVEVGQNFFLNNIGSGSGPELKYNGAPVVAGQFAPYTPIAVEQTAGGYEVALQNSGGNLFSIWNTDSSGNFVSFAVYSGTSTALESLETSFHQDLNGDGTIGLPPLPATVIEALGSTSLVEVGQNFFLNNIGSGSGPELKYNGAPVVAGQFAPYTPIAVEQTAGGYEVALQNSGGNLFSIWNTDSSGNFVSFAVYSGTSTALESLETSFHQDLNGDGVIGVPSPQGPAAAQGAAPGDVAAQLPFSAEGSAEDNFFFRAAADPIWTKGSGDKFDLDMLSSAVDGNQLTADPNDVHTVQSHSGFQLADFGHEVPGNHESMIVTNVALADLQAGHFIVR